MTKGSDDHWFIQLAVIEEIAAQPKSSIEKLHFSFMEKLGQSPDVEHIDCFIGMVNIPDSDVLHYLKYRNRPEPRRKDGTRARGRRIARSVCSSGNTNSLSEAGLSQAFERQYGCPPSERYVQHYLQKTEQQAPIEPVADEEVGNINGFSFIDKIAENPQATVLKFRQQYSNEYGTAPSDEMIQYFLSKNQKQRIHLSTDSSKMYFATSGADGSLTTVLEFRRSFLQKFGEAPNTDITRAFIAGLTSRR